MTEPERPSPTASQDHQAGLELRARSLLQVDQATVSARDLSPRSGVSSRSRSRRTSFFTEGDVNRHGHRVPGSQYAALALWSLLLVAQYGLVRLACDYGIPPDCRERGDPVKDLNDLHYLLFDGGLLAIFAGVHWPDRFQYIFNFRLEAKFRGVFFIVIVAGSGVGWGALSLVPGLKSFSLTGFDPRFIVPMLIFLGGTVIVVSWHFWVAWRHNSWAGFLAYSLSRAGLLGLYGCYIAVKLYNEDVRFHFHHYIVAFLAAALAEFNHPVSLVLLAGGTGIFVQGLAVYGPDAIISHETQHFFCFDEQGRKWRSPAVSEDVYDFTQAHCSLKGFV